MQAREQNKTKAEQAFPDSKTQSIAQKISVVMNVLGLVDDPTPSTNGPPLDHTVYTNTFVRVANILLCSHQNDNALVEFNGEMVNPANVRGISKKASGEASVAGAEELDDDDIDVANPQGGSGDDGMMPGLVDSFP